MFSLYNRDGNAEDYATHLWHETVTNAIAAGVIAYGVSRVPGLQEQIGSSTVVMLTVFFATAMLGAVIQDVADYELFSGNDIEGSRDAQKQ